jgi:hypothetical protein
MKKKKLYGEVGTTAVDNVRKRPSSPDEILFIDPSKALSKKCSFKGLKVTPTWKNIKICSKSFRRVVSHASRQVSVMVLNARTTKSHIYSKRVRRPFT